LKTAIKRVIIKSAMTKRRKDEHFDEVAADLMTLPENAAIDYNNSYYFAAHDMEGNAFFYRLGQRGGVNGPVAEIWFGFQTHDGKMYMNSQMLYELDKSPCKVKCIEPLKKWEFTFNGAMVPVKPGEDLIAEPCGKEVNVEFSGIFTSSEGIFEFGRDTHVDTFSAAIAAEKWTKEFKENLKSVRSQKRTEQFGYVESKVKVEGKEYAINATSIRDQAFGKRIWSDMNHYSWLVGGLQDETCFNLVTVYYPILNKVGLATGYHLKNKEYVPLVESQFPKEQKLAGIAPTSGVATAKFADKTTCKVEFDTTIIFPYVFTDEHGGYNVFECISTFNFNGVKGAGITEWSYNQDRSRLL